MAAQPILATVTSADASSLTTWRAQVLNAVLVTLFGLSSLAVVAAVYVNWGGPQAGVLIPLYLVFYAGIGAITFLRQIPYAVRAGALLAVLYALALVGTQAAGLSGDGRVFLLTGVVMAALLFGRTVGYAALGLAVATLGLFGWLFGSGALAVPVAVQANTADPAAWVTGGVVFLMLAAMMAASATYLLQKLSGMLGENTAMLRAIEEARRGLESQVEQRTAALSDALAHSEQQARTQAQLLAELTAQRETIQSLSIPVIPVADEVLVMPLVGVLDTARLQHAQEQALRQVEQQKVRYLVIDVTGVPIIDTQVAHGLMAVVEACRLLGAQAVLVGIRPEVAQTIVGLGLSLDQLETRANLRSALALIMAGAR